MASTNSREMDVSGPPPSRPDTHLQGASASFAEHGATKMEDSLATQQLDLLGPAYMLEWWVSSCGSLRHHFDSAEELRVGIQQTEKSDSLDQLFVIHGLPVDHLKVLQDLLNIDARFIDAHVGRRTFRPLTPLKLLQQREDPKTRYACFEYPELLTARNEPAMAEKETVGVDTHIAGVGADIVGEPPVHAISQNGDVAMFCHASLWSTSKATVLFLDRPAWTRHNPSFHKARYRPSHVSATGGTLHDNPDEIPCFETLLYESLGEKTGLYLNNKDMDLFILIEAIAAHQWAEFFEALPSVPFETEDMAALYWQAQASLERNLRSSKPHVLDSYRKPSDLNLTAEWEALLARLARRTTLASHLAPSVTTLALPTAHTKSLSTDTTLPPITPHHHHQRPTATNPQSSKSSAEEANQHSLDRVSYMGGILLPLSIVSSILSMSDPFGPGGGMFFVFWAVSIPLVFIAILIIYADSIRKAEVWIEVNASNTNLGETGSGNEKPSLDDAEAGVATGVPYLAAVPVGGRGGGLRIAAVRDDGKEEEEIYPEELDEPVMMVEKAFRNAGKKKWRKEQLGWMGACKTALRIYKLKKGRPPSNWAGVRRGRTA
ncbi:hypothetical protein F5Y04DRAFT_245665 [Hypomontagnella monticulosa]|nr:hypothetical protein F5Y04DRAFT_245665 [Hypomontagnella monticulosa]